MGKERSLDPSVEMRLKIWYTLIMKYLLAILCLFSLVASASEISSPLTSTEEIERARKRQYPGGRDEEELKVLVALPEFSRKTDDKTIQKEIYKNLFNQELKEDTQEPQESTDGM